AARAAAPTDVRSAACCSCAGGRDHDRGAARQDHRVLVLRREVARLGEESPAVLGFLHVAALRGQDRLDRDDGAVFRHAAVAWCAIAGDVIGRLVQRAADAVTAEVLDDAEAVLLRRALDGCADAVQRRAGARDAHGRFERLPGRVAQAILERRGGRYDAGSAGVREIAVELRGYVDVDDVAGANDAVARYAVRGFLVDADAGGAREIIGELRR